MEIALITIFPEMFNSLSQFGVVGRAFEKGIARLHFFNPRDFTHDNYHRIDERPYGGGPGMVMLAEPLYQALCAAKAQLGQSTPVYFLSPQGPVFSQKMATQLSKSKNMILICGRYEGVDQRFIDAYVDHEVSIGQYIVSGGELPAMVILDALIRLLPGVLGDPESALQESFQNEDELDYPVYAAPRSWQDHNVPEVLLSGNHKKIKAWRDQQAKAKQEKKS